MKNIHVIITFIEPVLGTGNSNKEIHSEFIASKAPDAKTRKEEIEAIGVEAAEKKATTVFGRDTDGTPILWNYQVKGFFKEACAMLQRMKGEDCAKESCKLKAYKKVIDGTIEPFGDVNTGSRKIPLKLPEGEGVTLFQKPLRGQTTQGERIALASSEMVPAGTQAEFDIRVPDVFEDVVMEWLEYGKFHGISQWRNAGYGRFTYEVIGKTP